MINIKYTSSNYVQRKMELDQWIIGIVNKYFNNTPKEDIKQMVNKLSNSLEYLSDILDIIEDKEKLNKLDITISKINNKEC